MVQNKLRGPVLEGLFVKKGREHECATLFIGLLSQYELVEKWTLYNDVEKLIQKSKNPAFGSLIVDKNIGLLIDHIFKERLLKLGLVDQTEEDNRDVVSLTEAYLKHPQEIAWAENYVRDLQEL